MNRFHKHHWWETDSFRFILLVLLFLLLLTSFSAFTKILLKQNSFEKKQNIEKALTHSITQCYVVEGTYPPNLKYLEENYGIMYDDEAYQITYVSHGAKLRPEVTITEK